MTLPIPASIILILALILTLAAPTGSQASTDPTPPGEIDPAYETTREWRWHDANFYPNDVADGSPVPRVVIDMADDPSGSGVIIHFAEGPEGSGVGLETWRLNEGEWTLLFADDGPVELSHRGTRLTTNYVDDVIVAVQTDPDGNVATWEFDYVTGWTEHTPAATPGPMAEPGITTDPDGNVWLLNYVGSDDNNSWRWDGQTWTAFERDPRVDVRKGGIVLPADEGRMILAGGDGYEDLWLTDGQSWEEIFAHGEGVTFNERSFSLWDPLRRQSYLGSLVGTGWIRFTEYRFRATDLPRPTFLTSFEWDIHNDRPVGIYGDENEILTIEMNPGTPAYSPVTMLDGALEPATNGEAYTHQFETTDGTGRNLWTVDGGQLPNGLELELRTGRLTGEPTEAGTFSFDLTVEDDETTSSGSFTLEVEPGFEPLSISGTIVEAANDAGWHNDDVTVVWDTSGGSGDVATPEPTVVTGEGVELLVTSPEVCDTFGTCVTGQVNVNIDRTAPQIGEIALGENPLALGETTAVTVPISDALSGVATATWQLETDGQTVATGPLTLEGGTASFTVGDELDAGVHTLKVEAPDVAGNVAVSQSLLVVYDNTGGFTTGGGWFIPGGDSSDAGDILPGIDGESKANFGFVARYQNGKADVPRGNFEFHYNVGDFRLRSADYEWLVVNNTQWAMFSGKATIAGSDELFDFRVDARDGGHAQEDRMVVRVWAPDDEMGVDDPIYRASGNIDGGQIRIRR